MHNTQYDKLWYFGFYRDYTEAFNNAVDLANECHCDVALRKAREFNLSGFTVHLAPRNDSDYAVAQIVTPGTPKTERKTNA